MRARRSRTQRLAFASSRQREEKEAIARVAASLVRPGRLRFSWTQGRPRPVWRVYLHGKAGLTVITTSLHVLRELGGDDQITLIATGGTVRQATFSFVRLLGGGDALPLSRRRALFGSDGHRPRAWAVQQQRLRDRRQAADDPLRATRSFCWPTTQSSASSPPPRSPTWTPCTVSSPTSTFSGLLVALCASTDRPSSSLRLAI